MWFDYDEVWKAIRSFGYTTKDQTDDICDALAEMVRQAQAGEEGTDEPYAS